MSYHNGSVWPHDNAILAAGFARYGFGELAARVLHSLYDAANHLELRRLPELYCGFDRRPSEGPTLYPVACSPQAWASAAPFQLVQSCLGLSIDAPKRRLRMVRPRLPRFLRELRVEGLAIGEARIDLRLRRRPDDVSVEVTTRDPRIEVVVVK
jgi:glycogen debranching enzyme